MPTFAEAAARVLEQKRPGWRSRKHPNDWISSLRAHAFPELGHRPVGEITTADILAVLTPIWHDRHVTARRVRQRIGAVMKWAVAMGLWPDNPAGDVLDQALGRQARPDGRLGGPSRGRASGPGGPARRLIRRARSAGGRVRQALKSGGAKAGSCPLAVMSQPTPCTHKGAGEGLRPFDPEGRPRSATVCVLAQRASRVRSRPMDPGQAAPQRPRHHLRPRGDRRRAPPGVGTSCAGDAEAVRGDRTGDAVRDGGTHRSLPRQRRGKLGDRGRIPALGAVESFLGALGPPPTQTPPGVRGSPRAGGPSPRRRRLSPRSAAAAVHSTRQHRQAST